MTNFFNWIKKMFSAKSEASSKRFNGTVILIGTAIVSWITVFTATESMKLSIIIACFTTGGALFGLTIFEKNQNNTDTK